MQIEWSEWGVSKLGESSKPAEEKLSHLGKDKSMAGVTRGGEKKKMSGCNGDTLRRDALKGGEIAVCGRVLSCSRGQERRRTE
jgi:hypothetical protein